MISSCALLNNIQELIIIIIDADALFVLLRFHFFYLRCCVYVLMGKSFQLYILMTDIMLFSVHIVQTKKEMKWREDERA